MKKRLIILGSMILTTALSAQVGINTPNPTATFDITAKTTTGTAKEGLLIPRVDRLKAQTMTGVTTSTLIYVNSVANGSQSGTAVNIDAVGFYFYNGVAWIKLNTSTVDTSIYANDGALAGNRIVTQGNNTLGFTSNSVNGFSVDGPTFSVDALNNRIGIGTVSPAINLAIAAAAQTGTSTAPEGVLIPRVDRQRAQSMVNVPNSTLLFVSNIATGGQTGTAINIDTTGYYYFDTSTNVWIKLNTGTDTNIYNTNGTLAGNRVVTQNANTLAFNGTAANAFSINRIGTGASTLFSADALNKRVGIGTSTPAGVFEIVADNEGGSAQNDFYFRGIGTSKYPAIFLTSSNGTNAAPANLLNNESIGKIAFIPRSNNAFNYGQGSSMYANYKGNGTTGLTDLLFMTSGIDRMKIDENGNIGIGTTAPTNLLHVNSATAGAVKIVDGTQANGRVLTSDANGVATWQTPATITDTSIYAGNGTLAGNRIVTQGNNTLGFTSNVVNGFSVDGSTFSVDALNNRIGIGTTAPAATLDLVGTTFGIKNSAGTGSWDNMWFNVTPSVPSINVSGAEGGLQFNVGSNSTGTYGNGQTLTTVATMLSNGNMGVGTTAPTNKLHVNSTTAGAIKIVDGTQANGRVLTSDANGVATWQTPPTTIDTNTNIYNTNGTLAGNRVVTQNANTLAFTGTAVNAFSVDGNTLSVDAANNRIGVGTVAPTNPLHVQSATAGAVKIVDGTQSNGAVLTSDANGVGTWKRASAQVVTGITAGGLDIPFIADTQFKYTGNSITLPPGKWIVSINQLVRVNGTLAANDWMFLRSTFSDQNLTTVGQVGTQSADVSARPTLMSFLIQGTNVNGGASKFDVKTGDILINNTSTGNKTYRYIVGNSVVGGAPPAGTTILSYGGTWAESSIFATAIN